MAEAMDHDKQSVDEVFETSFVSQMRATWNQHGVPIPSHLEMPFLYPTTLVPIEATDSISPGVGDLLPASDVWSLSQSSTIESTSQNSSTELEYPSIIVNIPTKLNNDTEYPTTLFDTTQPATIIPSESSEEQIDSTEIVTFDTWTCLLEEYNSPYQPKAGRQDVLQPSPVVPERRQPTPTPISGKSKPEHPPLALGSADPDYHVYNPPDDDFIIGKAIKVRLDFARISRNRFVETKRTEQGSPSDHHSETVESKGVGERGESMALPRFLGTGPLSSTRPREPAMEVVRKKVSDCRSTDLSARGFSSVVPVQA